MRFYATKGFGGPLFSKNARFYSASARRSKRKGDDSNDDNSDMPYSQPTESVSKDIHTFEFDPKEFNTYKLHLPPELTDPVKVSFIL
jgi:hypothetical protein